MTPRAPQHQASCPPGVSADPQERGLSEEQVPFAHLPPGRAGHQRPALGLLRRNLLLEATGSQTCPTSGTRGPTLPRSRNVGFPVRSAPGSGSSSEVAGSWGSASGISWGWAPRALSWPSSLTSHLPPGLSGQLPLPLPLAPEPRPALCFQHIQAADRVLSVAKGRAGHSIAPSKNSADPSDPSPSAH